MIYGGWHPFLFSEDALVSDSSARSRVDAATRRWVERLERFAAGHHTVVAFCAAEGVSESNFYRSCPADHVPFDPAWRPEKTLDGFELPVIGQRFPRATCPM